LPATTAEKGRKGKRKSGYRPDTIRPPLDAHGKEEKERKGETARSGLCCIAWTGWEGGGKREAKIAVDTLALGNRPLMRKGRGGEEPPPVPRLPCREPVKEREGRKKTASPSPDMELLFRMKLQEKKKKVAGHLIHRALDRKSRKKEKELVVFYALEFVLRGGGKKRARRWTEATCAQGKKGEGKSKSEKKEEKK